MNKAITRANGEWLFFLNAGDRFADDGVLHDIAAAFAAAAKPLDCVYGDVVYFGVRGQRRKRFHWLTPGRLVFGDLCHQAAFVRRDLFTKLGNFDTGLRYNADFDWFIRLFRSHPKLRYLHRDIALFHDAGAHALAHGASEAERNLVRARYMPRPLWLVGHWALRVELKIRRWLGQEIG
jgi:GT2 family glycosyltransferase